MAVDTNDAIRAVIVAMKDLDKLRRSRREKSVDFVDQRDAMVYAHEAWQGLIEAIKGHKSLKTVVDNAVSLAAVAMKMITDLAVPVVDDEKLDDIEDG